MKQPNEKRQHERFDARIQIQFSGGDEYRLAYSRNISKGGIFVESESLPDPNATIELILDLSELHHAQLSWSKDQLREVKVKGRVVRLVTVSEKGKSLHKIAIQFFDMTPATQVLFDEIYEVAR